MPPGRPRAVFAAPGTRRAPSARAGRRKGRGRAPNPLARAARWRLGSSATVGDPADPRVRHRASSLRDHPLVRASLGQDPIGLGADRRLGPVEVERRASGVLGPIDRDDAERGQRGPLPPAPSSPGRPGGPAPTQKASSPSSSSPASSLTAILTVSGSHRQRLRVQHGQGRSSPFSESSWRMSQHAGSGSGSSSCWRSPS